MKTNRLFALMLPVLFVWTMFASAQTGICGKTDAGHSAASAAERPFSPYVERLCLDGRELVYDRESGILYATLPESLRDGADYEATLSVDYFSPQLSGNESGYCPREEELSFGYKLMVEDSESLPGGKLRFPAVSCLRDYMISLTDAGGNVLQRHPLRFTYLPLVEITLAGCTSMAFTRGSIRLVQADADTVFVSAADFRYRGSSTLRFDKKSFAVKLCDDQGNATDRRLLGLRDDNSWVLDAMVIDKACMRNRVSTDLWNDFSTPPYHRREGWEQKVKTGARGRFVEVFLNGTYHGLYCLSEKIDRKQLRLKKYVPSSGAPDMLHGVLYKPVSYCSETMMRIGVTPAAYDNDALGGIWTGFEVKYPDWESERIDWGPLWNAINFAANSTDEDFAAGIGTYFDLPQLIDLTLFINVAYAADNTGKNLYYYVYDVQDERYGGTLGVAVWDVDFSWGRDWEGKDLYSCYSVPFAFYNNWQLLNRLSAVKGLAWNERLCRRYAELRKGEFSAECLVRRFTSYRALLAESGAALREQWRWPEYHDDIVGDVDDILLWIDRHLSYLDEVYAYDPEASGIGDVSAVGDGLHVVGGSGCIVIGTSRPQTVTLHAPDGRLVRRVVLTEACTTVGGLYPGWYIVAGRKVWVRR